MKRFLIIDGPNLTHAAQSASKLTVGGTQVQAIYSFLRTMRGLMATYVNSTPIVLWDGASWRRMLFTDYKNNREKDHTASYKKQQEERDSAKKQIPAIRKGLSLLGIAQAKAMNMEADDLAAIIGDRYANRGDKVMLISADRDWVQLVRPGIMWFDPINDRKIMKAEDVEKTLKIKVADFRQFLEIKCLMGDTGDAIPGVGGIGEKYAQLFMETWGSWANFSNGCLDGTINVEALPKHYRALAESEDKRMVFARNLDLMDLRTRRRPDPVNLTIDKGTPSTETFRLFCQKLVFRSFLKEYDNWVSVFPALANQMEPA
jgi:5'-3' exonuclease